MIFYFSGTGNSQMVAQQIAKEQQDQMIPIVSQLRRPESVLEYELKEGESIIFVFPVYAFGPPQYVTQFINRWSLKKQGFHHITLIVTCAENIGNTVEVVRTTLAKKGLILNSAYCLVMPNNYCIVGKVDSEEIIKQKLTLVDEKLKLINQQIKERVIGEFYLEKGSFPHLKTTIMLPLFNKFVRRITPFYANDHCISCKVCEKICPTQCIKVEKKPKWHGECVQCLACLHYCPKSAIQYGTMMANKQRYTNPKIPWFELNKEKKLENDEANFVRK